MGYCNSRIVPYGFAQALERVQEELRAEGFGILTEIDVQATLKKKLDVDFRPYRILGACNPPYAYRALQAESRIGVLLPCNVIVQVRTDGQVEVSAVNPQEAMQSVANPQLAPIAGEIAAKLQAVLARL